ncbi:DUF4433 domain-containing protein [Effusibacillus dendaii]|uniref:DarT domain-containing protein n=1 Tax=Effusibacillus dendaii TaxID=2743772 RepID=A0A7I8DG18_9BACL|nr:DUF4433 domain-containing protein [Effusibacillus dendaii]BCJ87806.1 hypothetical protein skT53_27910 [Effusibacillus dendaii]
MNTKSDANEIRIFIDQLQKADFLDDSRSWWPRFIFHFTNINNAVEILEKGKLFSRNKLKKTGGMVTDNASTEVIQQTDGRWKDFVRLYFRPRTPTQNRNEGYRPLAQRKLQSHCPVPIYFMFDAKQLLSREDAYFSKGSLAAASTNIYSKAVDFKEIPFQLVYHDSWFEPHERASIIHHRQAEVVVKDELDLENLKHIWCRSEAEYKTLLNLLSPKTREKWKSKIGGGKKGNLFFRDWIFVEEVNMNKDSITFKFNVPMETFDVVAIKVKITEMYTQTNFIWENTEYKIKNTLEISLKNLERPEIYDVTLLIDNQIMFFDKYNELDFYLPF